MGKSYTLFVSLLATVFSLAAMAAGIMLANTAPVTFWQMICYDLIFIVQFLTFLWCGLVYYRQVNNEQ